VVTLVVFEMQEELVKQISDCKDLEERKEIVSHLNSKLGYNATLKIMKEIAKNNEKNYERNLYLPLLVDYQVESNKRKNKIMPRSPKKIAAASLEPQEVREQKGPEAEAKLQQEEEEKKKQEEKKNESSNESLLHQSLNQASSEKMNEKLPSGKPCKIRNIGTKEEVYRGEAKQTGGRLTQKDLMLNSRGNVISIKKHESGKKNTNLKKKKDEAAADI
jgi:hypothetical protein